MSQLLPTEDQLREWITQGTPEGTSPRRYVYPPECVEATVAIRRYLTLRCGDSIPVLIEHARAKGYDESYNYFYQLLTGRYFRPDPNGRPQGSWKKVVDIWRQLQIFDRFASQLAKVLFVETSVWKRIHEYIAIKRTPFNCCRFGGIVGGTGSGKSECFKELMRREKVGTIFRIEAPARASLSEFIHKCGDAMGSTPSWGSTRKKRQIVEVMSVPGRVLIVDNVQRAYHVRSGVNQPIFDYLQEMQEDTNCTIILSWTPVDKRFGEALGTDYFEQFIGRIGGERELLRLEDYLCDEDLELICESFKLPAEDVAKCVPRLHKLVREKGRIRNVFNALQSGARIANAQKKEFRAHHLFEYLGD